MNTQQQEALEYFRRSADDWKQKADGRKPNKVNVVKQRHDYVLAVAKGRASLERTLDVGCGTGDLVCELSKCAAKAVGIDFAPEMIGLCRERADAAGVVRTTEFVLGSVFEYQPADVPFDLISANGFIEYISPPQLSDFIDRARRWMCSGGSLVIGSRNRLFNAVSLNEFTQLELEAGTLERLLAEAVLLARAVTSADAIAQLLERDNVLPSLDRHPDTGVGVATRHQYTPGQLVRLLKQGGFSTVGLLPIHYHCAVPRFGREQPSVHWTLANVMQEYGPQCHYLVPFASSFMLHATRDDR